MWCVIFCWEKFLSKLCLTLCQFLCLVVYTVILVFVYVHVLKYFFSLLLLFKNLCNKLITASNFSNNISATFHSFLCKHKLVNTNQFGCRWNHSPDFPKNWFNKNYQKIYGQRNWVRNFWRFAKKSWHGQS